MSEPVLKAHDHPVLDCKACQDRQNDTELLRAEVHRLRAENEALKSDDVTASPYRHLACTHRIADLSAQLEAAKMEREAAESRALAAEKELEDFKRLSKVPYGELQFPTRERMRQEIASLTAELGRRTEERDSYLDAVRITEEAMEAKEEALRNLFDATRAFAATPDRTMTKLEHKRLKEAVRVARAALAFYKVVNTGVKPSEPKPEVRQIRCHNGYCGGNPAGGPRDCPLCGGTGWHYCGGILSDARLVEGTKYDTEEWAHARRSVPPSSTPEAKP